MALTIAEKIVELRSTGSTELRVFTVLFDNSYTTGGLSFTAANARMSVINYCNITPTAGYTFEYDYTNSKIKAYVSVGILTATLDAASRTAITAANETPTVTGAAATDVAVGWTAPQALAAGVDVQSAWVSGGNTVTTRVNNASANTIDPASGTYTYFLTAANGAQHEVPSTTDLSAVTARVLVVGHY